MMNYRATHPRIKSPQQSMREKVIYVDGSPITAQQVALFLLHHPDFLTDRSQLLESLGITHVPEHPKTASLIERQIEVLRKKNQQLNKQVNTIFDINQQNQFLFHATRQLTLKLLMEKDPYILLSQLKATLLEEFNIQQVKFFFFKKHLLSSPEYGVVSLLALHKKLPSWKNIHSAHYGPWGVAEQHFLFPQVTASLAVVPFDLKNPFGFMALEWAPSERFKEKPELPLLNYLGDLAGKLLSNLLDLDEEENHLSEEARIAFQHC